MTIGQYVGISIFTDGTDGKFKERGTFQPQEAKALTDKAWVLSHLYHVFWPASLRTAEAVRGDFLPFGHPTK